MIQANANILRAPAASDSDLHADVVDFFQMRRSGHLGKWLYSSPKFFGDKACGAATLAQIVHDSKETGPYYIFRNETATIAAAQDDITALIKQPTRLIDLGPGSQDAVKSKVFPTLEKTELISEYVAVDVCDQTNRIACQTIENNFRSIPTRKIFKDFISNTFHYGIENEIEIALLYGLTVFNIEIDPRVENLAERILDLYLKRICSHFSASQKYLVVTQDINQDEESLRNAYCGDFYKPLLHLIERDLDIKGNYNPDAFEVKADFFVKTKALSLCFVAKEDMAFTVNGNLCQISKNERFYFLNSYKFDEKTFTDVASSSGLQLIKTMRQKDNSCILHILKKI